MGEVMKLTAHLHLVQRLRISETVTPHPPHARRSTQVKPIFTCIYSAFQGRIKLFTFGQNIQPLLWSRPDKG
jgi:hypothetical protein